MTEQTAQQFLDSFNFMLDHVVPWLIVYGVFKAFTGRFDKMIAALNEINGRLMLGRR